MSAPTPVGTSNANGPSVAERSFEPLFGWPGSASLSQPRTVPSLTIFGTTKFDVVDAVRINVVELSDKGLVNAPSLGLLRRGLYH